MLSTKNLQTSRVTGSQKVARKTTLRKIPAKTSLRLKTTFSAKGVKKKAYQTTYGPVKGAADKEATKDHLKPERVLKPINKRGSQDEINMIPGEGVFASLYLKSPFQKAVDDGPEVGPQSQDQSVVASLLKNSAPRSYDTHKTDAQKTPASPDPFSTPPFFVGGLPKDEPEKVE
jgi:hypothetical protein